LLNLIERVVDDALGDGLLAVFHDAVDEARQHLVVVARIAAELFVSLGSSASHSCVVLGLGYRVLSPGFPILSLTAWRPEHQNSGCETQDSRHPLICRA